MKKKNKPLKKGGDAELKSTWLYGWKEIAKYIGCCIETAQKYEKKYNLPIRRLPNGKLFARPIEIENWSKNMRIS